MSYNEAGRRIKAPVISSIAGYSGVDSTLKKLPPTVEQHWIDLAQNLSREMLESRDNKLPNTDDRDL